MSERFKPQASGIWYIEKVPADNLDYSIDWSDYLTTGESIASSSWSTSDGALMIGQTAQANTVTTVWLNGGLVGRRFEVVNAISTSFGRTIERTFEVEVTARLS